MAELKLTISRLRQENWDNKRFIPHQALKSALDLEQIRTELKDNGIEPTSLDEMANTILSKAIKIFAILVLINEPKLITRFLNKYGYFEEELDGRLPFDDPDLERLLGNSDSVNHFREKQWEFVAPVFSGGILPRALREEVILPFIEDEPIGQGGSGDVFKIKIHPAHQTINSGGLFARKEFYVGDDLKDLYYHKELHSLSILRSFQHPNILEVKAAYTHGNKYNLIFNYATSGDLDGLLRCKQRPQPLECDEDLLLALTELSIRIAAVHRIEQGDLKLIGCYHHLRPQNILIHDGTFLLGDFGLSKFKIASRLSRTKAGPCDGEYNAPEYGDLDTKGLRDYYIHRSSDIWSFGCIIAELVTYMIMGEAGVETFYQKRKFDTSGWSFYSFHNKDTPSIAVQEWLSELELQGSITHQELVCLIRRIIVMRQEMRPKANQVAARLTLLSLEALATPIHNFYVKVCNSSTWVESDIERVRFQSWQAAISDMKLTLDRLEVQWPLIPSTYNDIRKIEWFRSATAILKTTKAELLMVSVLGKKGSHHIFEPLSRLKDQLLHPLPVDIRQQAELRAQSFIFQTTNLEMLRQIRDVSEKSAGFARIKELAAIKEFTILFQKSLPCPKERSSLKIRLEDVEWDRDLLYAGREMAFITTDKKLKRHALVEWRRYNKFPEEKSLQQELFNRTEAIANLLNSELLATKCRTLRCFGFYHKPSKTSFGLLFDFPHIGPSSEVKTLKEILDAGLSEFIVPFLGQRFAISQSLSKSIYEFHKLDWLHKDIASINVIFFTDCEGSKAPLGLPYLMGFRDSRQGTQQAYTGGNRTSFESKDYQDPRYLQTPPHAQRFAPPNDYYSLGIVLLEIGLWKSMRTVCQDWECQPGTIAFRDQLLKDQVPLLGVTMGVIYRDIVQTCLCAEFDTLRANFPSALQQFYDLVVTRLLECNA